MNCLYCGKELPDQQAGEHHRRVYCDNKGKCKQADYRKHQSQAKAQAKNNSHALQVAQLRIAELERAATENQFRLAESQEQITELEQQVMRLHNRLDLERRYYDNKQYSFKAWLKKHLPQTEFTRHVLADQLFMPRDTRAHYEYYMRRVKYSQEDMQEFTELWKLMLLQM